MKTKNTYLYVLLLPHMDKEYNLRYKVKFGYTEDFKSRMKTGYEVYYGNGYQVLHVYKGDFTKKDEFAIKQYLKEYCLFKEEWFKCCKEVLGFFATYNTTKKLKQRISEIPVTWKSYPRHHKVNYMLLDYIIQTYHYDIKDPIRIQDKRQELEMILRGYSEKNQYNYLKEKYKFVLEKFTEYRDKRIECGGIDEVNQKVEEFNGIKTVKGRLRFLMDYSERADERDFKEFLELIPGKYKDYYTIVGPEIIKAYGCEESKIKKAWREKVSNSEVQDDIVSEIYGTFVIGQRYTKSDIKETLKGLYEKMGYKKTAKATDLELYYYMKPILTPDKKHGFELMGKR